MVPEVAPAPTPACVLLVEDEVLLRLWIADELREAGFTVIEAMNADEASLIIASGVPIDLLLSDVHMPGSINGLEFAGQVRSESPTLPIIITSGNLGSEGIGGVGRLLPKPYSAAQVIALVSEILPPDRSASKP